MDIRDEGLSDGHIDEYDESRPNVQGEEEKVGDSYYEHGCYCAVGKSPPPVKPQGIRSR